MIQLKGNEIIKRVKSINIEVETNVSDERIIKFCDFFKNQDVTLETDSDKVVLTIKKSDNKNGSITRTKNIREDINFKDRLSHNNRR